MMTLKQKILNSKLINKRKSINSYIHKSEYITKHNLNEIVDECKSIVPFARSLTELVYCVLNDVFIAPTCYCGNLVEFEMFSRGYRKYCSCKCKANDVIVQANTQSTNLAKYGVKFIAQLPEERIKRSKALLIANREIWDRSHIRAVNATKYVDKYTGWNTSERIESICYSSQSNDTNRFREYRQAVYYLSNRHDLTQLNNHELRNTERYTDAAYHMDHIVSITHCFNNGIHPLVCASLHNLRFIHWAENSSKGTKSDMCINKLLELYNA